MRYAEGMGIPLILFQYYKNTTTFQATPTMNFILQNLTILISVGHWIL